MKPIPTSGIAIFVVSVTTRTLPWAPTPTPPPITMPSISATYGLLKRPICAFSTIFVVPELSGFGPVGAGAVIERDEVAAGAEAALAGTVDDDGVDVIVVRPVGQHRRHRVDHRVGQRIDGLGPVEGDQADAAIDVY